jgi:hypothetical protein
VRGPIRRIRSGYSSAVRRWMPSARCLRRCNHSSRLVNNPGPPCGRLPAAPSCLPTLYTSYTL